jgi:hypothetical protein
MGRRQCELAGCSKGIQAGGTPHCIAHGGGKRCQHEGCTKSAIGDTEHCVAHGGGKRCQEEGCIKSAIGDTGYCKEHGGGKRCQDEGCLRSAVGGGTTRCAAHGGGRRCQQAGCTKSLERARSTSDELTVLYSNGPDDKSVKLALGYVTTATSDC